ncbi:MAG: hypothetical protein KDH16_21220 [Rhodocyclaceae bacterium]|nr:hypothetical protein [Rhodocyclaceae bacterium]
MNERNSGDQCAGCFQGIGWEFVHGPNLAPDGGGPKRSDSSHGILRARFVARFDRLKDEERVALAGSEGTVNHARLCTVSSAHPAESTRTLQYLTQLGMLNSSGSGRGAGHFLPGRDMPTPDEVFSPAPLPGAARSSTIGPSSSVLPASFSVLARTSQFAVGSLSVLHLTGWRGTYAGIEAAPPGRKTSYG